MRRISTTPGQNTPNQGEKVSQNYLPRDPISVFRGVTRNLSEIISYSALADPPGVTASMFKTSDPTPIEELAGGACEIPCTP